ncbi:Nucleolin, partial [Aptenodytes forsteri]
QKAAVTPAKKAATPAKKAATPAKKAITPAKKTVATPAKKAVAPSPKKAAVLTKGAKNGKNAKKEESEEEDEDDEEDEEEEEEEEDSDEEEEPAMPVKPAAKKPAAVPAKKPAVVPAKQESEDMEEDDDDDDDDEDDESEDEAMDTTPLQVKKPTPAKAAPVKAKADSEDEEDEEDDEEEEDEEEEDEEDAEEESEDEKPVKEAPGKRKKEMANKSAPEAKKKKTDGRWRPTSAFSLFVGNLVPTKEYEELKTGIKEFFGKKNIDVLDVRIGASKRFGYVDFSSAEDLDKALQLNGKKLMGLEIKLEKAKSKETMKENKKERDARTLFVKNLPYRLTEDEMRDVFENAQEIRIVMNKEGNSKGMAYVEFKTEAEANKALEEKQGTEIDGRAMVIDFTGEKSHQEHQKVFSVGGGERESKTLIVNNLSYAASEETLQELFKKASSIKMPQTNQGRPKGYAFVEFPTAEDAKEALNSCNNTEIEGRAIRLEFSSPAWQKGNMNARGGFNQQSKTLFVRGLSEDTTEETLRESFEGSISARIVTDRDTGSSKGFGFVDFSSPEDAKAAKEAMEDGEIDGNKVILDFAKPKGEFQRGGGFGGGFGGRGGRGGGRGGRGGFGGRGGGRGFGGRGGGFRGGRGGGGDHKPQGKKIKFE